MNLATLLRGLLIGLSIAAPVGPMGVLCIRRTLSDGRWIGLATGLGVATADGVYGAIAGFGITVISNLLLDQQTWIRLIGGLFLCYLGAKTAIAAPAANAPTAAGSSLLRAYASAFALTLTNPTTILSFVAIFAGVGVGTRGHAAGGAATLVLGVLAGSALWWLLLTSAVALVRAKITPAMLAWVNRISGSILMGFGAVAIASLLVR